VATHSELRGLSGRLLERGEKALRSLSEEELVDGWSATVETYRDSSSAERRALDPVLGPAAGLSPGCLSASLEALLDGYRGEKSVRVIRRGRGFRASGSTLAILPSTVPGIALQTMLHCLALRQPLLVKASTAQPYFAAAFRDSLAERLPAIAEGVAVATWTGGDPSVEEELLSQWRTVVCYGTGATIDDLRQRIGERLVAFGPKASLAIVSDSRDGDSRAVADGLARDICLFEQRGCLSLQAIYTEAAAAEELCASLAEALERALQIWPPPFDSESSARRRQVRMTAELQGLRVEPLAIDAGNVLLDRQLAFQPSPGLRTVHVHPLEELEELPRILEPHAGLLQAVSLSGRRAEALQPALEALGVSRFAAPGELQSPPADWRNDGVDLMRALGSAVV